MTVTFSNALFPACPVKAAQIDSGFARSAIHEAKEILFHGLEVEQLAANVRPGIASAALRTSLACSVIKLHPDNWREQGWFRHSHLHIRHHALKFSAEFPWQAVSLTRLLQVPVAVSVEFLRECELLPLSASAKKLNSARLNNLRMYALACGN
jgi:hypothetical protein